MRRYLIAVQVWGPGAIALISLLASIAYGIGQQREIGRLEGRVYALESQANSRLQIELNAREEFRTLQAYVVSLEKAVIRSGISTMSSRKEK